MYWRQDSFSSFKPSLFIAWLLGIQIWKPDFADVPPQAALFSSTMTEAPARAAAMAAALPAAPEPHTTTSTSASQVIADGLAPLASAGDSDALNRPAVPARPVFRKSRRDQRSGIGSGRSEPGCFLLSFESAPMT